MLNIADGFRLISVLKAWVSYYDSLGNLQDVNAESMSLLNKLLEPGIGSLKKPVTKAYLAPDGERRENFYRYRFLVCWFHVDYRL